jgi:hypothetical protein
MGAIDERLSPDLPRGRGKSIGGDLNIDDKSSEQTSEPLQSLNHDCVGYQLVRHELNLPRRLINTSKNEEDAI